MPVEIKELLIRVAAGQGQNAAECRPASGMAAASGRVDQETVEACVMHVMRILKKSQER